MIDEQTLTQFGIQLDDEFPHPFSADHGDWNESYFFDWYNKDGAGQLGEIVERRIQCGIENPRSS